MKQSITTKILIHTFFVLVCLTFIIPFMYVISLSITSDDVLQSTGYALIPKKIDFAGYTTLFRNPTQILNSYKVTIAFTAIGTLLSMIIMTLAAYPLSKSTFKYKKQISFYMYFTMLFSGGLIPSYIINTRYLNLGNNFWVYVLPALVSAYYIIILRTFFSNIPSSLLEAARIDGAKEYTIFWRIILPLSKPVLATVALFEVLGRWNNWNTSLYYIRDSELFSLQYLLQKILRESEFLEKMSENTNLLITIGGSEEAPVESMRFAMAIVAAGPMLVIFPFFQKYFTKGLTVGSVKG